ncbi:UvrD-helicase domain-containing protein [Coxiella endosymbiont of Amblyomma americanum]|uniref:UvrD-helicase domain-containing protein n=1 Tax=Coxiella endosymbiont of Amblyomma americanum TaxID=325775 RepID=UPI00068E1512|nr:UvrD-helicase domain-containing protein [Coxiella endosymbiont of Amblyomma americanum]
MESLNSRQKEAVTSAFPYICVLAGAGSGKTRVLIHRIAWLIQRKNVSPYSILAVTFTNKAANEMRRRIESMGIPTAMMWIGTFHSLSHYLLRIHWKEANLPQSFQILDSEDQYRLIHRIQKNFYLEETQWPVKKTQWFINKKREENIPIDLMADKSNNRLKRVLSKISRAYEDICYRSGLIDFPELLLRSLALLQNVSWIKYHYQQRFLHILVDEFQDTSVIQYTWLRAFIGNNTRVMIMGDDDQSIYSWRGAKIENIHRFSKDFSDVQMIRLEQNYRSTKTILDAANAVIKNNVHRFGKKLWTLGDIGERVTIHTAFNEREEAVYVVSCIEAWIHKGGKYGDIAVLYRSNVQSRLLEELLFNCKIPYQIYGNLAFFERIEIKDALSYLCLLDNRHADMAFERIINVPTRGIGDITLMALRTVAYNQGISLWKAAMHLINSKSLNTRLLNSLQQFLDLIELIATETKSLSLAEQTKKTIHQSGLFAFYKKDRSEKGTLRVANLETLINFTVQFTTEIVESEKVFLSPLNAFLSHVALGKCEEQKASLYGDCVNLMTLHAAKGLEFPLVIITGLEENIFPHHMSVSSDNELEEERRLCYVGITRAKEKLILTCTESRYMYGLEKFNQPSRFLSEIPLQLTDSTRFAQGISRPISIAFHVNLKHRGT